MNQYVTPIHQSCPQCGITGVAPRISKHATRTHIVEEAKWVCHRCGHFWKRGIVSEEPKPNQQDK